LAEGENSDNQPEDGWELLFVDFGKKMDGSYRTGITSSPKLILYNKYESKLRVFIASEIVEEHNSAVIKLEYNTDDFISSLLSPNQVLSDSAKVYSIEFPVQAPNNNTEKYFYHTDIPVYYDPCACFYKSTLYLDSYYMDNYNINLEGALQGNLSVVTNNDVSLQQFMSFSGGIINVVKGVVSEKPGYYVAAVRDFVDFANTFKKVKIPNYKASLTSFSKYLNYDPSSDTTKASHLKTIAMLSDGLTAQLKSISPGKSITTFQGTMKMTGTAKSKLYKYGTHTYFSTPRSLGSKDNPEEEIPGNGPWQAEYTLYNELLGLFALLKKPKVEKYVYQFGKTYGDFEYGEIPDSTKFHKRVIYKLKKFPANNIEYIFNNAANINIEKTKISVAFEVSSYERRISYIYTNWPLYLKPLIKPDFYLWNTSFSKNIIETYKATEKQGFPPFDSIAIYSSPFVPLNRAGNLGLELNFEFNDNIQYFPRYPDFYTDYQWSQILKDVFEGNVYLKFMIEYEFNTIGLNGKPNKGFAVYKFPVEIETVAEPIDIIEINNKKIEIERQTFDSDTTFTTESDILILGNIIVTDGNVLNIKTAGDLIISNGVNINSSGNGKINIECGGSIIGNYELKPNVNIEFNEYSCLPIDAEIPPITDSTYIANFCKSNQYKARYAKGVGTKINNMALPQKNNKSIHLQRANFVVYPNPVSESVTLSLNTQNMGNAICSIKDISGKEYYKKQLNINSKYFEKTIDVSNFPPGIYFVNIKSKGFSETKKLIVQ